MDTEQNAVTNKYHIRHSSKDNRLYYHITKKNPSAEPSEHHSSDFFIPDSILNAEDYQQEYSINININGREVVLTIDDKDMTFNILHEILGYKADKYHRFYRKLIIEG